MSFEFSIDSLFNLGMSGRSTQKNAADPKNIPQTVKDILPANGFTAPPVLTEPSSAQADFYRNGKASEVSAGAFEIEPRRLEEFQDDESPATIRILRKEGDVEKDLIPPYSKFLLQGINRSRVERSQIVETFGDFYVFMYGQRPPIDVYNGTLINSSNANWVSDFDFYYDNFLRGTKCVELQARAVITSGGKQIEGLILNATQNEDAMIEGGVGISFQIVVTGKRFLGFSNDFTFSTVNGQLTKDADLQKLLDAIAGATGKGQSDPAVSSSFGPVKEAMAGGDPIQYISNLG